MVLDFFLHFYIFYFGTRGFVTTLEGLLVSIEVEYRIKGELMWSELDHEWWVGRMVESATRFRTVVIGRLQNQTPYSLVRQNSREIVWYSLGSVSYTPALGNMY